MHTPSRLSRLSHAEKDAIIWPDTDADIGVASGPQGGARAPEHEPPELQQFKGVLVHVG
jgi:hypothetical protein